MNKLTENNCNNTFSYEQKSRTTVELSSASSPVVVCSKNCKKDDNNEVVVINPTALVPPHSPSSSTEEGSIGLNIEMVIPEVVITTLLSRFSSSFDDNKDSTSNNNNNTDDDDKEGTSKNFQKCRQQQHALRIEDKSIIVPTTTNIHCSGNDGGDDKEQHFDNKTSSSDNNDNHHHNNNAIIRRKENTNNRQKSVKISLNVSTTSGGGKNTPAVTHKNFDILLKESSHDFVRIGSQDGSLDVQLVATTPAPANERFHEGAIINNSSNNNKPTRHNSSDNDNTTKKRYCNHSSKTAATQQEEVVEEEVFNAVAEEDKTPATDNNSTIRGDFTNFYTNSISENEEDCRRTYATQLMRNGVDRTNKKQKTTHKEDKLFDANPFYKLEEGECDEFLLLSHPSSSLSSTKPPASSFVPTKPPASPTLNILNVPVVTTNCIGDNNNDDHHNNYHQQQQQQQQQQQSSLVATTAPTTTKSSNTFFPTTTVNNNNNYCNNLILENYQQCNNQHKQKKNFFLLDERNNSNSYYYYFGDNNNNGSSSNVREVYNNYSANNQHRRYNNISTNTSDTTTTKNNLANNNHHHHNEEEKNTLHLANMISCHSKQDFNQKLLSLCNPVDIRVMDCNFAVDRGSSYFTAHVQFESNQEATHVLAKLKANSELFNAQGRPTLTSADDSSNNMTTQHTDNKISLRVRDRNDQICCIVTKSNKPLFSRFNSVMSETGETGEPHRRFLIITNVAKKNNVTSLINIAMAFKFEVILVAWKHIEKLYINSSVKLICMDSLDELSKFLCSLKIEIVGIELAAGAKSILDSTLFTRSIAFMPGNEGDGLSSRQKKVCTSFAYIPHYGQGTASLNVFVATTIVLNYYSDWLSREM